CHAGGFGGRDWPGGADSGNGLGRSRVAARLLADGGAGVVAGLLCPANSVLRGGRRGRPLTLDHIIKQGVLVTTGGTTWNHYETLPTNFDGRCSRGVMPFDIGVLGSEARARRRARGGAER